MQYRLKLNGGKHIDLRFSNYFLSRVCALSGHGLSTIYLYLMGDLSKLGEEVIIGGMLDDNKIRAQVIASAWEAELMSKGEPREINPISKDVYDTMDNIEGGIASEQWGQIFSILMSSMVATLPKQPAAKKKETVSRSPGKKLKTARSAK